MALKLCTECGQQVSDKAVACPHCGAPVERPDLTEPNPTAGEATVAAMTKCKDCGRSVSREARTCPHCGRPIRPVSPLNLYMGLVGLAVGTLTTLAGQGIGLLVLGAGAYYLYQAYNSKPDDGDESEKSDTEREKRPGKEREQGPERELTDLDKKIQKTHKWLDRFSAQRNWGYFFVLLGSLIFIDGFRGGHTDGFTFALLSLLVGIVLIRSSRVSKPPTPTTAPPQDKAPNSAPDVEKKRTSMFIVLPIILVMAYLLFAGGSEDEGSYYEPSSKTASTEEEMRARDALTSAHNKGWVWAEERQLAKREYCSELKNADERYGCKAYVDAYSSSP